MTTQEWLVLLHMINIVTSGVMFYVGVQILRDSGGSDE